MLPTHGHEGRVDRKLIPAPPPTHQPQTRQAIHECYSTRYVVSLLDLLSFLNCSATERTFQVA